MDYKNKYLKYKNKYINLRNYEFKKYNLLGGTPSFIFYFLSNEDNIELLKTIINAIPTLEDKNKTSLILSLDLFISVIKFTNLPKPIDKEKSHDESKDQMQIDTTELNKVPEEQIQFDETESNEVSKEQIQIDENVSNEVSKEQMQIIETESLQLLKDINDIFILLTNHLINDLSDNQKKQIKFLEKLLINYNNLTSSEKITILQLLTKLDPYLIISLLKKIYKKTINIDDLQKINFNNFDDLNIEGLLLIIWKLQKINQFNGGGNRFVSLPSSIKKASIRAAAQVIEAAATKAEQVKEAAVTTAKQFKDSAKIISYIISFNFIIFEFLGINSDFLNNLKKINNQ